MKARTSILSYLLALLASKWLITCCSYLPRHASNLEDAVLFQSSSCLVSLVVQLAPD